MGAPARVVDAPPARVSFARVLRAAARQHRAELAGCVAVALALVGLVLGVGPGDSYSHSDENLGNLVMLQAWVVLGIGMLVAVPLVARELERDTCCWAWTQDVTPRRWLLARILLLGPTTTLLCAGVGVTLSRRASPEAAADPSASLRMDLFEASGWEQAGAAAFAFGLGLALVTLVRRRIPAMVLTFVGFLVVRLTLALGARLYWYAPPFFAAQAEEENHHHLEGAIHVGDDYYQPLTRMGTFHLVEFTILLALGVALLLVAVLAMRPAAGRPPTGR